MKDELIGFDNMDENDSVHVSSEAQGEESCMLADKGPDAWLLNEPAESYGGTAPVNLKDRTGEFALRIIRLCASLPKSIEAQVIAKQVLRSGTSVGAHYREAVRARSDAEIISKLEAGLQELEETRYWMELLIGAGIVAEVRLAPLCAESDELAAILVTCVKRIKSRKSSQP